MASIISYLSKPARSIWNDSEVFWDDVTKVFPVSIKHNLIKPLRHRTIIKVILLLVYILTSMILLVASVSQMMYSNLAEKVYNGIMLYEANDITKIDGKEIIERGPRGLHNSGSSCYMNAIIQALASCNVITERFDDLRKRIETQCKRLDVLLDLLRAVNDPRSDVRTNTKLLKLLMHRIKWNRQSQQDVYHSLMVLISEIGEEVGAALSQKEVEIPLRMKVVHKQSQLVGEFPIQNHIGLSVGLCGDYDKPPGVQLEYLIEESLSPMMIDGDESKTTQMIIYEKVPEILILHIQANRWDSNLRQMVKPAYYIIYDEHLVLDLDICKADSKEISKVKGNQYKLTAVVHHMSTAQGGHYVTYRRHGSDWYLANDSSVERVKFSNAICPYIMIYKLANDPDARPFIADL